ncbi:CRISPR-associated protein, Cmr4 family [Pseudomonas pohangensis]|uniref:CRISPR-associated protein, Cmr4 family n=1 Tax=Pseudomonas pohangensis TaxID=364197 RepID=A0A1H2G1Q2_9PSED|nr:type III-B CRISPR module RAMP protein Cmr4 [Pseudomonas pohangensis]SDU13440.1 CRISPR-associated protein, Cmr4 family [Pseudomonas pohangensis]
MSNQSALLILTTETSLHAGTGQSIAGIDLPIQREVHTNWPCVFGSAVKGALRAKAFHDKMPTADVTDLFGPEHAAAAGERDTSHAGALLVGDAHLLLLPVRSLQSCFKWVTCPAVLRRVGRDAKRLGLTTRLPGLPPLEPLQALGSKDETVFLEEFRLEQQNNPRVEQLAGLLAPLTGGALDKEELLQRLVVVHDDIFSFLAKNATSVNAHIAIDAATKTVRNSALWYEESLPPESVLYVPLTATASRRKGSNLSATEVLGVFAQQFPEGRNWLQLGGNETTGMGWCRVGINQGTV